MKLLLILLLSIGVYTSHAQVLWYADPNKNYLESFYRLSVEAGEVGEVSTVNDPVYGKVWNVRKPAGSKRAELSRTDGYIPAEGDIVFVGWRWKANIVGNSAPGFAIFQNKSDGTSSQNYPFLMGYNGTNMGLSIYTPGTTSQESRGKQIWSKPVSEGEWVSIVLGITYSKDASKGRLEMWFNGVKQDLLNDDLNKQITHRTLDDNGNYFKWGAYNEASRNYDITINLDEMRVAKDYASAEPNNYTTNLPVTVSSISLSPATLSLTTGQTSILTASILPANATNKSVTYSTSNAAIASVSATGVVTAVAAGSASITVKTVDGNKIASTAVTINNAIIAVSSVSLSPATLSLTIGQTSVLTASVLPANATNKSVTYSTSNAEIASVSATGVVTAVAAGSASITVKTVDGNKIANSVVTVTLPVSNDPIIGVSCSNVNATTNYELTSIYRTGATSYSWWFTGSAGSFTPVAGSPYKVTITYNQYYSGGSVCVGINYSQAPYYKNYCKVVGVCGARIDVNEMNIDNFSVDKVSLFPNPISSELLFIESNEIIKKVEIKDGLGIIVKEVNGTSIQSGISTASLPVGTYLVKIILENEVITKKLMVVR